MLFLFVFFFNDTATTEIYTLSLHDALPIFDERLGRQPVEVLVVDHRDVAGEQAGDEDLRAATEPGRTHHPFARRSGDGDRKSTRLNSSHGYISYAVFCLKKKKYAAIAHGWY